MFPYCKVFIDSDMYIDVISYFDEKHHGFKRSTQIGYGLVSFCEQDINPFVIKIKELLEIPFAIRIMTVSERQPLLLRMFLRTSTNTHISL